MKKIIITSMVIGLAGAAAYAASNKVSIKKTGNKTCIMSNGTPNHSIGQFPNRGNPNRFKAQKVSYCFPTKPVKTNNKTDRAKTIGITLTGIPIRPGTADWYDGSTPRGFSRNRRSGWNLEGMGPGNTLGMDRNNAHVDNRGLYHYHGMPSALININNKTLLGYAADGHEIHYVGSDAKSSWVLKSGTRPTAPRGRYDGTYNQDFQYKRGVGNLDECNGGKVNGKYVYFATDTYPFFQRCHWGKVSSDFTRRGG